MRNGGSYYIAVDGGGSKTELCAFHAETSEMRRYQHGSSNYKIIETDVEKDIILKGIVTIFEDLGIGAEQVRGLVMGMSGIDSPEDHEHYRQIAAGSNIDPERIYICNDSELAFYSQGTPPGLCMIAGTGSVATGIGVDQEKVRVGGWGSPISDEGSGGWIGIRVLRDLLRYCDGYGEYIDVFDAVRDSFGAVTFETLPKILSQVSMIQIAGVAKVVMDAADVRDSYCLDLVTGAAELTAEIAYTVYRRLKFEKEPSVDIVMAGSLYKSGIFTDTFKQSLILKSPVENLYFCEGISSPVLGGITLAQLLFGKPGRGGLSK